MRIVWMAAAAALALGTSACQKEDTSTREMVQHLKTIDGRLEKIEHGLQTARPGAARPGERAPARKRPDPATTYAVPIDDAPSTGKADALITIVEAFEYACPYCEQARPIVEQIARDYPDEVRVVYKNFVVHPQVATVPAWAACAADLQGRYADMSAAIWDKGYKQRKFDAEHMKVLAAELGLDARRFESDMTGAECKKRVAQDQSQMAQVGVSGTPAFYINGRQVTQRSVEGFKLLVEEELAKAKERIAAGSPAATYYRDWILGKGVKSL